MVGMKNESVFDQNQVGSNSIVFQEKKKSGVTTQFGSLPAGNINNQDLI